MRLVMLLKLKHPNRLKRMNLRAVHQNPLR
jgi:hypothetical protein